MQKIEALLNVMLILNRHDELQLAKEVYSRLGQLLMLPGEVVFATGDLEESGFYLVKLADGEFALTPYDEVLEEVAEHIDYEDIIEWVKLSN